MLRNYITASALLLSAAAPQVWAGEAGRVVFVTGQAQLAGRAAAVDLVVNEGDELTTGADGYVYVKTVDAGFLILRPNSKARIAAYQIDSANPGNNKVKLELLGGVARAISGQGVKQSRQNFRFNTPVAAIGVRGTDFVVYTDQHTSRVSVVSGGVVMAGFDGNCKVDGAGPCEGSASRELFAGQAGMLLQIQRGQQVPQLLNNPALAPDQTEKPRYDEPVGKVATTSTLSNSTVNLDPQKSGLSLDAVRANVVPEPAVPPVVVTPPPLVVVDPVAPVVTPPKPQEIFWGRWTIVADKAVMPAAIKNQNTETPVFLGDYAVARLKGAEVVLPTAGTVAFTLTNSEAVVQRVASADSKAAVESGKLAINFANRSFETGLVLVSGQSRFNVDGKGAVDYRGYFESSSASQTLIRGYLSGAHAEEAAYVFKNTQNPGLTLIGATSWKK